MSSKEKMNHRYCAKHATKLLACASRLSACIDIERLRFSATTTEVTESLANIIDDFESILAAYLSIRRNATDQIEADFAIASRNAREGQQLPYHEPSALSASQSIGLAIASVVAIAFNEGIESVASQEDGIDWQSLRSDLTSDPSRSKAVLKTIVSTLPTIFTRYGDLDTVRNLVACESALLTSETMSTPRSREINRVCEGLKPSRLRLAKRILESRSRLSVGELCEPENNESDPIAESSVTQYITDVRTHLLGIKPPPDCEIEGNKRTGWITVWNNF